MNRVLRCALIGFVISLSMTILFIVFLPVDLLKKMYFMPGVPLGILLSGFLPQAVQELLTQPDCLSGAVVLGAYFTWGFLFSSAIYGYLSCYFPTPIEKGRILETLKVVFVLLTGFIWIFVLLFMILSALLHSEPFSGGNFDQQVWLKDSGSEHPNSPRGKMAKDLQTRLLRDKPIKKEVLDLLGKPDGFTVSSNSSLDLLSYNLGAWSGFRIDYNSLDIYFDAENRVCRVCIVPH
jgi:hypothetical protein